MWISSYLRQAAQERIEYILFYYVSLYVLIKLWIIIVVVLFLNDVCKIPFANIFANSCKYVSFAWKMLLRISRTANLA